MNKLNEQFEDLIKQSRRSKNSNMRSYIRRELFKVTEQIKQLNKSGPAEPRGRTS
jgi:hypothetical protein